MTKTSTVDALKNIMDGKPPIDMKLGGPKAPYKQEQDVKLMEDAAHKKAAYLSLLSVGTWVIEFTKVDGSPSTMECTLDPRLLPPVEKVQESTRPEQPNLLHVYALDRQPPGWRSCKVLNIQRIYSKPSDI